MTTRGRIAVLTLGVLTMLSACWSSPPPPKSAPAAPKPAATAPKPPAPVAAAPAAPTPTPSAPGAKPGAPSAPATPSKPMTAARTPGTPLVAATKPAAKITAPALPSGPLDAKSMAEALGGSRAHYEAKGRRDPFENMETKIQDSPVGLTIAATKLTAIVRGTTTLALVEDAKGVGYILKPGDTLGDGRVVEIGADSIVFVVAPKPGSTTNRVVLRLQAN